MFRVGPLGTGPCETPSPVCKVVSQLPRGFPGRGGPGGRMASPRKVQKRGNSLTVTLPPEAATELGVSAGDYVLVTEEGVPVEITPLQEANDG